MIILPFTFRDLGSWSFQWSWRGRVLDGCRLPIEFVIPIMLFHEVTFSVSKLQNLSLWSFYRQLIGKPYRPFIRCSFPRFEAVRCIVQHDHTVRPQLSFRFVCLMTSRYRVEYHLKSHRRDEWIKGLLVYPFILRELANVDSQNIVRDRYAAVFKDLEGLIGDHSSCTSTS